MSDLGQELDPDQLFVCDQVQVERNHNFGRRLGAFVGVVALAVGSCWLTTAEVIDETDAMTVPATAAGVAPISELPANVSKETMASVSTTASSVLETPPTTKAPASTTTTERVPEPWEEKLYIDNGCDEGDRLQVVVQSENGNAVGAQVSVDYWMGNHKVGLDGQPIPEFEGYSEFVYINPSLPLEGAPEGTRNVCFENIPHGASVYVEVYSKNFDAPYSTQATFSGSAMSGQMWPGPNQTTYLTLPLDCGVGGSAGTITVRPHSGDIEFVSPRMAAWDDSPNVRAGTTRGFAAENVVFTGTPEVRTLLGLTPNRSYLLQSEMIDTNGVRHTAVVPRVPVGRCQDTLVDIDTNLGADSCVARVGSSVLACSFNDRIVG